VLCRWRRVIPPGTASGSSPGTRSFPRLALRLHEAGLIRSSPQKIIADGTDWRFLNELKRELKA
jgi:hypothetical protein